ncbi:MAG: hypothetical protein ACSHX9_12115 [Luteolibacter sp.]
MSDRKKIPLVPILLVVLPLWLIASAGFALVKYFKDEKKAAIEESQRFSSTVSTASIKDDLRKIITLIGERNTSTPDKLAATSSMIQGTLGPANTGYQVTITKGPSDFPLISVTVSSEKSAASPIWVITSYDSPPDSPGSEKNATGLVATLATAQALANASPTRPIHFIFTPHANDPNSPILETAATIANLIKVAPTPHSILIIESMGDEEDLILSSRDTEALPTTEVSGLGKILGAEVICLSDDFDLASTLFEMNLPAIRVATRPPLLSDELDDKIPFAPTLAASTGRLVELIKRLDN